MTRVAVVGCGYWGPNVVRNFAALPGCELRWLCDLDPGRLAPLQRRYPGTRVTTDFAELLRQPDLDAVAICTPLHTHHALASAALRTGRHVLVEKPLADSVQSCEELIALADAGGLALQVDHTFVYSGAVQKIRSIVESGTLGELLYFDSVRVNLGIFQSDMNVVWDLAPHDLSIMDYLIGRQPLWVSAIGSAHFGRLENLAYLTLVFDDSLIAHLHVNWLAPVKIRSTLIGGSERLIVYDDLAPGEAVRVYDKGVTLQSDPSARSQALVDYRIGDMFAPHLDKTEPLERVCRDFLGAIASGGRPLTDGAAGLRVVRLLEAAQQSLRKNGERVFL